MAAVAMTIEPAWDEREDRACPACLDHEEEVERLRLQLAKVHQLLRTIKRVDPKPAKAEGIDDDQTACMIIGHATALAAIRARIDLYFQTAPEAKP